MGWQNPIPSGAWTQGFGPSSLWVEGPAYADGALRKSHDADNGPSGTGQGPFPGSTFYQHFHAALDIAAPEGTNIHAPESGLVLDAQWGGPGSWANGGGYFFRVEVNEFCMYLGAHCSDLLVRPGQRVTKGQIIARVGATGVATGNHLHFWARLGPKPYYDPSAYYWNPALVLPNGPMYDDPRFAPGYEQIPDTGLPNPLRVDGDPAPMKARRTIKRREVLVRVIRAGKPIREQASIKSKTIRSYKTRHPFECVLRVPKENLPPSERQYGDVFVGPIYTPGGDILGYVKGVDLVPL